MTPPFSPRDLAPTLAPRPGRPASPLPPRAYTDESVLAFERREVLARSWSCVAREQEVLRPGDTVLAPLTPAGVAVVRGPDLTLRALHNVCRHRASCLLDPDTTDRARIERFTCPYHGWTYDLRGSLTSRGAAGRSLDLRPAAVGEEAGLVFVCPEHPYDTLATATRGLAAQLGRWPLRRLHLGRRRHDEARANWKLLAENFLESHHFPGVHPALERCTPTAGAATLAPEGAWFGGTMAMAPDALTASPDRSLGGRRPIAPGLRQVHDFLLFPACMLSVQPDYLLVYRLTPLAADRTRVTFEVWLHPSAASGSEPEVDPLLAFWDEINAQDRLACERQQHGLGSAGGERGVYLPVEESCARFAAMIARSYLGERPWLERTGERDERRGEGRSGRGPPSPPHAGGEARWGNSLAQRLLVDDRLATHRFARLQRASPPACGGLGGPRPDRPSPLRSSRSPVCSSDDVSINLKRT